MRSSTPVVVSARTDQCANIAPVHVLSKFAASVVTANATGTVGGLRSCGGVFGAGFSSGFRPYVRAFVRGGFYMYFSGGSRFVAAGCSGQVFRLVSVRTFVRSFVRSFVRGGL